MPAGEARDPRRAVPFALIMTIVIVTVVMTLAQVVALGTLPGLADVEDAAGRRGRAVSSARRRRADHLGAVFSTTGNNMGQALSGSRNLFALAEQGDLPRFFGRVHPRFRTPVERDPGHGGGLAGARGVRHVRRDGRGERDQPADRLRRDLRRDAAAPRSPRFAGRVAPATFVVPFGPVIPVAAIVIALAILAGEPAAVLLCDRCDRRRRRAIPVRHPRRGARQATVD